VSFGSAFTNLTADAFAASRRFGVTSVDIMLRLTSMLIMTTVLLSGVGTAATGRATVKITAHSVAR